MFLRVKTNELTHFLFLFVLFFFFFKDLRLKIVPKRFKVCTFLVSQFSFRRQEKAPLRLWLGSALHLYTFFRLYR